MNIRFYIVFLVLLNCYTHLTFAQEALDIVNPYEIKANRSKQADTFYFSENAVLSNKAKLDTLRTYDVFLEIRKTPFGDAYMCNGNEISRQKYEDYKLFWNSTAGCKPCILYTYNDKEEIKFITFQYKDCLCGSYTEYYPNGQIKVKGQFKENNSSDWLNMRNRGLCNIRVGNWMYYYESGVVQKSEMYEEGRLKSFLNYAEGTESSKNKQLDSSKNPSDNEEKKNIFQRLKAKIKD